MEGLVVVSQLVGLTVGPVWACYKSLTNKAGQTVCPALVGLSISVQTVNPCCLTGGLGCYMDNSLHGVNNEWAQHHIPNVRGQNIHDHNNNAS